MKLNYQDYDQLTVMTVQGDLVSDQADRMRKEVLSKFESKTRDFVLDLENMEFIDSEGLEALLWLQEQCIERLGQVRLASCQDNVKVILQITRLASQFDCHNDVESAIKSLR